MKYSISEERERLLDSINFSWVGIGSRGEKTWDENFEDLLKSIDENGNIEIPTKIGEQRNPLYTWFNNQKLEFSKGKLDEERIEEFKKAGIELSRNRRQNPKTWDENFVDLLNFVDNGKVVLSQKNEDKLNPLYSWFNNQKSAYKIGKLSQEKIERFKNAGIDLSIIERNAGEE